MPINVLRTCNFFYFSLFSIFLSFLPVYLTSQGVSETQTGFMIGMGAFVGILSQPLWGVISDRKRTIKKVLQLALGFSVLIGTLLFQMSHLVLLLLLVSLLYFFFLPTDPLVESLNFQLAQKNQIGYGSVRMFGALGFAISSLLIGYVTNRFSIDTLAYLFLGYGIFTFLLCFALTDAPASKKPLHFRELKAFLSTKRSIGFFLLIFLTALPSRMNDYFIGIYIGQLGGTMELVGQAWFVMTMIEVVFFSIVHRFMKPGSELKVITFAAFFYTLRFLLCGLTLKPVFIVWYQLFQGVTFVLFYTAAIQYLYTIVPDEWKSTGQTVLAVLFFGVSGVVGSVLGGWFMERFGGSGMYLFMACLSAIAIGCSLVIRAKEARSAAIGKASK
ncbi:MFS transporter [Brevibacillus fluminis]|uniref:MFS transporter n=1 Tax=Brevibacillus fluminis TaxID=511487 RepID=UPI003F8C951F